MKKQAISFFFFIMLNLAMAREANLNTLRFSPAVESSLIKNKIAVRKNKEEDTACIAEISVDMPMLFKNNYKYEDGMDENRSWYRLKLLHHKGAQTGYLWNLPVKFKEFSPGQNKIKDFDCYGISSFDRQNGFRTSIKLLNTQETFELNSLACEGLIINQPAHYRISLDLFTDFDTNKNLIALSCRNLSLSCSETTYILFEETAGHITSKAICLYPFFKKYPVLLN